MRIPTIRSCFAASPGKILLESDYRSAEVYGLGKLSNCEKLILDAAGDLHARGAVTRFGAPSWAGFEQRLPPPEEWLIEHKAVRTASKAIVFGIPYQRGAAAIARQIVKDTKGKFPCDKGMAQGFIDGFYDEYREVKVFVDMCKQAVLSPGFLENPFGRRRRATPTTDEAFVAQQQREFVNFPIQSVVADLLNITLINLHNYRKQFPGRASYRILLAVHDAVLLECTPESLDIVVNEVLPSCMTQGAVVPSWQPTSNWPSPFPYTPTKPFVLDIDVGVYSAWGVKVSKEYLHKLNVPEHVIENVL